MLRCLTNRIIITILIIISASILVLSYTSMEGTHIERVKS